VSPAGTATSAVRQELGRKALHAATAVIPVGWAAGVPKAAVVGLLGALAAIAVLVEVGRRASPPLQELFLRLVGPLLRPHEANGAIAGATWMFGAYLSAALVAPPSVAVVAMWAVSAGDGAAAVVGRVVGRVRLPNGKSLEGALAMCAMTAAGAWGLAGWSLGQSLAIGAVASAAELPTGPLDDNVRVTAACVTLGILMFSAMH
jgi:dolichol kinase